MKRKCFSVLVWLAVSNLTTSALAQGTFQNLGFESANVPDVPSGQYGGFVSMTDGLPGWIGYIGTNQASQALQNNYYLAVGAIAILGPNFNDTQPNSIIAGRYSVIIEAGSNPFGLSGDYVAASISQTGMVPADAKSLQFKLGIVSSGFGVSFAGHNLGYVPLSSTADYTQYGADISAYAGQSGLLQFITSPDSYPFHKAHLDDIEFSTQSVPEPSVVGLIALSALLLGWRFTSAFPSRRS